jgi:protein-tyrosine phosphatase
MKAEKVLFVCQGNICRSPTAEAIFNKLCEEQDLPFTCDSAGLAKYHVGDQSDRRAVEHAGHRGYEVKHTGRQITDKDLENFDWILGMDEAIVKSIHKLDAASKYGEKIRLITNFCHSKEHNGVPEPLFGNSRDFDLVIEILEDSLEGFLEVLTENFQDLN